MHTALLFIAAFNRLNVHNILPVLPVIILNKALLEHQSYIRDEFRQQN